MNLAKTVKIVVSLVMTVLAIWAVVYIAKADLAALTDTDLDWPLFVLVIPMYFVITIARGARVKVMTGATASLWLLSSISAIHVFITKVFPFRSGEIFLPIMLKRYKVIGLAKGSGILLSIRLIDFILLFWAVFVSSFFVRRDYFEAYWPYLSAGFFLCLVPLVLLLVLIVKGRESRLIPDWNLPGFVRPLVDRINRLVTRSADAGDAGHESRASSPQGPTNLTRVIAGGIAYSGVSWVLVFASFFYLLDWAGIEGLTFPQVILGSAGAIIAGFLPINTLLSLGTIEAGWTASLYLVGVDPAQGVIAGFRIHGAIFFFNILFALLGMLVLQVRKRRTQESANDSR